MEFAKIIGQFFRITPYSNHSNNPTANTTSQVQERSWQLLVRKARTTCGRKDTVVKNPAAYPRKAKFIFR
jgi:hypothetical protein